LFLFLLTFGPAHYFPTRPPFLSCPALFFFDLLTFFTRSFCFILFDLLSFRLLVLPVVVEFSVDFFHGLESVWRRPTGNRLVELSTHEQETHDGTVAAVVWAIRSTEKREKHCQAAQFFVFRPAHFFVF
jgi:hypothetical protein